jgi:ABC-type dipeptide/oligopeptide/nickel transport system permease component
MGTLGFIGKRILFAIFAFFVALTIVFMLYRLIENDPVNLFAPTGHHGISEEQKAALIIKWGLDKSYIEQYFTYIGNIFQGDLGISYEFGRPVMDLILERLPWTLLILGTSTILSTIIGVLIGAYIGWRRASQLDATFVTSSLILNATPLFFTGIFLIFFFGYAAHPETNDWKIPYPIFYSLLCLSIIFILVYRRKGKTFREKIQLDRKSAYRISFIVIIGFLLILISPIISDGYFHLWFPISGGKTPGIESQGFIATVQNILHHSFLPIVVLTIYGVLAYGWFMRGNIIGVLTEDYVQTAVSKGLSENEVLYRHCMRNAILPVVTDVGMSFGSIIGGSVIVEQVFSYPGTGDLIYNALLNSDYHLIQGSFIIITALTLLGLVIAEVLYGVIDPRIQRP